MTEKNVDKNTKQPPKSAVFGAYETHFEALKRFISRLVSSHHDVDDIAQEAFLRAYNAETNKEIDQPKSYLFRVAKNVALNQLRQKTRRPTDYLEDYGSPDMLHTDSTLEDEIMAQQKLEIHCAAVASLPAKCRKVYLMRKVYAMTHKEIATSLGISVSTVESHVEKGFARCNAYVERHLRDGDIGARMAVGKGEG
jgi:RNA polymerase sigma factor (sigma-70 family)